MMTDTERAITFFENALENCVMVAREPFETALAALRRTAEDDKAREEYHTLPGKSICVSTCGGKRLTIVIDVEAALGGGEGD